MRVIPVLDLKGGRAVHARGGRRDAYAPITAAPAGTEPLPAPGDAPALARGYRERLGAHEVYVADLDAIAGGAPQWELVGAIARLELAPWVDAGIATAADARLAIGSGAARVVVGLETLPGMEALAEVAHAVGGDRVVFSLDLRDGEPVTRPGARLAAPPVALAERAVAAGASAVIVLDLARVGRGAGLDLGLVREIRRACPLAELIAGGGARGRDDLERLADSGADAALVATALHEGRLTREDLEAVRRRGAGGGGGGHPES